MSTEQTTPTNPPFDFGEAMASAVVQAFWNPVISGYTYPTAGPDGTPIPAMPMQAPSPLDGLVRKFQEQYGQVIKEKVYQQLDLDDLAERAAAKVADRIVEELGKKPEDRGWGYRQVTPNVDDIQRRVRDKVADKLSGRALEEYDARQAAMWDAYQREQERERQAAIGADRSAAEPPDGS